jgi:hypothetical protein
MRRSYPGQTPEWVISIPQYRLGVAVRRILQALIWIFIVPGDWVSSKLGVTEADNRDLVRMLVNSLFWIAVVVIGLAIWTSTMPEYQ